ncbi:hypothetical protein NQ315_003519 [Exocentrus adspersus]|uniref:Uncharacterized protein n=1 Tax=Exocentrus adspersus TaxID=1586481 RepID=A0AAV8V899_9CUCU|nr:hypothetical protein NQ315_003519 [Exocentrus adspersus]
MRQAKAERAYAVWTCHRGAANSIRLCDASANAHPIESTRNLLPNSFFLPLRFILGLWPLHSWSSILGTAEALSLSDVVVTPSNIRHTLPTSALLGQ